MTDTLTIFGTQYTGVKGFKAEDGNNNTLAYIRPQGNKAISENGTNIDVAEFATVNVSVSGGGGTIVSKSITENGTYNASSDNADGYSPVTVNVPTGTSRTASDVTVSGDTVSVPAGLYSSAVSKSVASGTAGTPTATKGAVSNHSVSVTPSVTNTTGYITGSTKTGTAVTVSASELVSGNETKTANGTYDVTNLASLVVAVPIVTYYTGSSAPSSSLGSNGDIYLQTS